MKKTLIIGITVVGMLALAGTSVTYAATTAPSQLTQSITSGVLSTDVRDASNAVVSAPSFAMSSAVASTSVQATTGTLGTAAQRLSVDNPGASSTGWTLALNATVPTTGTWTSGANSYPYNGTATSGQLTVDPSTAIITPVTGTLTGVTKGGSATFTGGTSITLMSASSSASQAWNGYITGISLTQKIPAGQAIGSYTFSMTQTVAAV